MHVKVEVNVYAVNLRCQTFLREQFKNKKEIQQNISGVIKKYTYPNSVDLNWSV